MRELTGRRGLCHVERISGTAVNGGKKTKKGKITLQEESKEIA